MNVLRFLCGVLLIAAPLAASAEPLIDRLVIVVPASAGGGFDRTAKSVAGALRAERLVGRVTIRYSPGAGGLIGLAQFEDRPGDDPTVLIGGLTILGAAVENHATVSLTDLVPLCQLYEAPLALAVRDDSAIRSVADLTEILRSDPSRIVWVGGSPGSSNNILLWAIGAKLGIGRDRLKYAAFPGGGDPVIQQVFASPDVVAVRNFEEFGDFVRRGRIRVLAVSTARRYAGIAVPTLREEGLDVAVSDWKGAFLSPRSSPSQRAVVSQVFARMLASRSWRRALAARHWQAASAPFTGFPARIASDRDRTARLMAGDAGSGSALAGLRDLLDRPWRYVILASLVAGLAMLALVWQRRTAQRQEQQLRDALDDVRAQIERDKAERGDRTTITRELEGWKLSGAEVEIAWMILKGLQFKEIAAARQTSERTVRQQAQAIYTKSGLPNRTAFSAHFLEDLRF